MNTVNMLQNRPTWFPCHQS